MGLQFENVKHFKWNVFKKMCGPFFIEIKPITVSSPLSLAEQV